MGEHRRAGLSGTAILVMVLAAACTSAAPPHAASSRPGFSTPGQAATPGWVSAVLKREGLALPASYRQACAAEAQAFGCLHVPAGPIPAALDRPLHFPVLRTGQRCPATRGTPFNTAYFGGRAQGTGPVRVLTGATRRGIAQLINPTSSPPWLALKTLWFSMPAYQGPFVIRVKRLDRAGPVALGEGPVVAPLVGAAGTDAQQRAWLPHGPGRAVGQDSRMLRLAGRWADLQRDHRRARGTALEPSPWVAQVWLTISGCSLGCSSPPCGTVQGGPIGGVGPA